MSISLKSDPSGTSGSVQLNGVDVIPFNSNGILATALLAMATAAGFAISLAANGYVKFPSWLGGWMVQWGTATTNSSGTVTTVFPLSFPTATLSVVCTRNSVSSTSSTALSTGTKSVSQFVAWNSAAATVSFDWFSVGY